MLKPCIPMASQLSRIQSQQSQYGIPGPYHLSDLTPSHLCLLWPQLPCHFFRYTKHAA